MILPRSARRQAARGLLSALLAFAVVLSPPALASSASASPTRASPAGPLHGPGDGVAGVSAVTVVVADLGPGAQLTRLAAARDDLYIVDAAPGHVRRYILHGLSHAELFTQVMRWKEGAGGLIMGKPLDLYLQGERLLILDDLASLWSYWGPDYGRVLVPLRVQSWQGNLTAVALHGSDLVLLDPHRRQVWTYHPDPTGGYDTVPRGLLARPWGALAAASRLAAGRDALLTLAHGDVLVLPWTGRGPVRDLHLARPVTGIWAAPSRGHFLVSFAAALGLCTVSGHLEWRVAIRGLHGESIRDLALDPSGHLYVMTPTRILRVLVSVPSL